ncbi:MAG: cell division protein FtsQ [Prevotella sp.]|nr:cell division protein FtsQ [Prevotella sp.]
MAKRMRDIMLIAADVCLAAYIVFVFCAFHTPDNRAAVCPGISVVVADGKTHGFIDRKEVAARVAKAGLDPKGKVVSGINCRQIEEALLATPFIRTAQCYLTINGIVNIEITQRMPVVRVKAANGDDYYVDDKDCIMPVTGFTTDVIIATGDIDRRYATTCLAPMARALLADDFARNLFQQINITAEGRVELVPQVGNNIIRLGRLPESDNREEREGGIDEYVRRKMNTLRTFYKYGLSVVGWGKYSVIDLEYDNQVVCKRRRDNTFLTANDITRK